MKYTTKHLIYISFAILILISGIAFFYNMAKSVNYVTSKFDFTSDKFDKQDSLIFKTKMLEDFQIKKIAKSSLRNTFKFYTYKKLYNIYITNIDLQEDLPIHNTILFNNEITSKDQLTTYIGLQSNKYYNIEFRGEKVKPVSKIISSIAGDYTKLEKTVHNKDFVSYCLPLYTFSLQYENTNSPIDIFVESTSSSFFHKKGVPFIVSFYKKEKSIYILLMTPINKNTKLDKSALNEFVQFNI